MQLDPVEMKPVLNRLKRARGQLDAVISSVENGQECKVAVQNLSAVSRALDRAGFAIISKTLQHRLQDTEGPATEEDLKEIEKMLLSLA